MGFALRIKRILCITLLIGQQSLFAQQASIQGSVVDHDGRKPIEFSTISVFRENDSTLVSGTVTDSKGNFTVDKLGAGGYYVKIQFLGYQTGTIGSIQLAATEKYDVGAYELQALQEMLAAIEVTGDRAAALHQIDKQIYNAAQFQNSQGGTATDVLKNLPSISVNSEGEITMRGSSSFIVLLDGKPTQTDPALLLSQLPANIVDQVEVITTPSSKYDPDGKAGIINITTKKGATDGYYLLFNAQTGLPAIEDYDNEQKPIRFGGDVTLNYKKNKWNLSLNGSYKRDDLAGYRDGEAETTLDNIFTTSPSVGERSYESYMYSLKGIVNYQPNSRNIIEGGFYAGKRSQFRTANIYYDQERRDVETGDLLNTLHYFNKNLRERKGDFVVANLDFTHNFKDKSTIIASGLYERTILGGPTNNVDVNPDQESEVYNHAIMDEKNPLDAYRFKTDYAKPVGAKGKFESGYQYRYLLHRGTFIYNQLDVPSDTWSVREELSNSIRLTRHIHAGYGQYSDEIGKLSFTAGLRLEYVDRKLKDQGSTTYSFERLNLFPSTNLLYSIQKDLKLKAGYSRRINHTTSNMMNPFPARRHSEVLETGDPELLPEYIDVTELGVIKEFDQHSVFITGYFRNTQNVINRVNAVYNDTILARTFTNAGDAHALGVEVGGDFKITSWWKLFAGGNLFQYNIKGSAFNREVDRKGVNYSFNANTTFTLPAAITLQLTVNYTSSTVTAQGLDSRFLIPSATIRKTILKGQGNISLQWQYIDLGILETNEQRLTTQGENFYTSTNYIQEVDILRVNFSYQLNKLAKRLKFTESEFGEKEF